MSGGSFKGADLRWGARAQRWCERVVSAPRCRLAIYREVAVNCRDLPRSTGFAARLVLTLVQKQQGRGSRIGPSVEGVVWTGILVLVVAVMEGWHWVTAVGVVGDVGYYRDHVQYRVSRFVSR